MTLIHSRNGKSNPPRHVRLCAERLCWVLGKKSYFFDVSKAGGSRTKKIFSLMLALLLGLVTFTSAQAQNQTGGDKYFRFFQI
jgi:hypothetical protein